ncbi:L,D-transpeptidase [Aquamicrobium sp. LC103]|uniref:L,D-transpeptidase n=1 Tax=Aquamicrobium sp. LC103 TaxID=1120658 RepID=UPI00063EA95F|nr:L,D-transpeptidase [Aquamicrobium sp. LC103]TKT81084.1 L,D-transpeptidase [Aquamicrobium sp. LC103]
MNKATLTRRGIMLGGLALLTSGCTSMGQSDQPLSFASPAQAGVDPAFRRTRVRYEYPGESPGTIIVNTSERYLYFLEEDGWATRYGVGVGEEGLTLKGKATIGRKAEWPSWTPTANMMRRKPHLVQYAGGVSGGLHNPLGARALYLYRNGRDTMFRLHGTNEPWTIGSAVSSGCIRLTNDDITHLYERAEVKSTVVVI